MLKHFVFMTYRSFKRSKGTFLINLIGLSTGLACTLSIYLWINDELNFDKFHTKDTQLVQVMANHNNSDKVITLEGTPDLLAESLLEEFPEVENSAAVIPPQILGKFTLSFNDINFKAFGQYASKDFFNMFSYDLYQGNRKDVLSDKNSIVLSEQLAMKLFNSTENLEGKTLEIQILNFKERAVISGVFKGIPKNSSSQFDFVLPFEKWKDLSAKINRPISWNSSLPYTYLVLRKNADLDQFNKKIKGYIKSKNQYSNITLFARKYSDGYLYGKYENGILTGGRIEYVKIFSVIAAFIFIIACINFINLSTAKAGNRLKEVGIKKTIGAGRKNLILQYLGESTAMALFSLIIAVLLVEIFLPQFNKITGKDLALSFSYNLSIILIISVLVTGLFSGSYPALYLSRFSPMVVLKGKINKSSRETWIRKGLIVFQFMLSVIFIVSMTVIYRQVKFINTKNPGYDKDNIIYFNKEGKAAENQESFLSEVKNIPGVVNASVIGSTIVGTQNTTGGLNWAGKNPDEEIYFEEVCVGYNMLETLGIEMKEGRSFSKKFGSENLKIIFNEAGVKAMGMKESLGKLVRHWTGEKEIIGVAKNFHFESLHEVVKPLLFVIAPERTTKFMVKIKTGKEKETIKNLRHLYEQYNAGSPFDFKFLSEDYQIQYEAEKRVEVLSKYFAGLAIIISCLGLFGLAAFTVERRTKEIGVRKVLGANLRSIIFLLSKDFLVLIFFSFLIALPIAWYITKSWLQGFAYRTDLNWWIFAFAGSITLLTATATISFQTVKAAVANPVKSLKYE